MKKYLLCILILIILAIFFSPIVKVHAEDSLGTCTYTDSFGNPQNIFNVTNSYCIGVKGGWSSNGYQLLAPLPCEKTAPGCVDGKLENFDTKTGLGSYLNLMIKIFIGIAAVLSVVMIVVGGLEYMTSELISSKEEGKKRILGAIFGLIIALGAYALLFTINPDLLKSDVKIPNITTPGTNNVNVLPATGTTLEQLQTAGSVGPAGICNYKNSDGISVTSNSTKARCDLEGGSWRAEGSQLPVQPTGPQGTCTYTINGNTQSSQETQETCNLYNKYNAKWTPS